MEPLLGDGHQDAVTALSALLADAATDVCAPDGHNAAPAPATAPACTVAAILEQLSSTAATINPPHRPRRVA